MPTFRDKQNREWTVELDPVTADEVQDEHGINLVSLESDPLATLRTDPRKLVAVIHCLCRDQIQELKLTPREFAKNLPFPSDAMMEALEKAIVNFFPTGRHTHVQAVLTSFGEMATTADTLTIAKMRSTAKDPRVLKAIDAKADQEIQKVLEKLSSDPPGTSNTEAETASM